MECLSSVRGFPEINPLHFNYLVYFKKLPSLRDAYSVSNTRSRNLCSLSLSRSAGASTWVTVIRHQGGSGI